MIENQAVNAFGALSHESRLNIVRFLVKAGKAGAPAGDVGTAINAAPSNASFHLAKLEHAGLVISERSSRQIIYRADFTALAGLVNYLIHDCCQKDPDVLACCNLPHPDTCC